MADSEEGEDYHFYGTPIKREEEMHPLQRRKEVRDAGATRALPLWKQVRSEGTPRLWLGPHRSHSHSLSAAAAAADLSQTPRRRPPQEPMDAQGRRRFHGAFTGGFSAGYYNTAGSAEGWTPSAFHSSRTDRPRRAPAVRGAVHGRRRAGGAAAHHPGHLCSV